MELIDLGLRLSSALLEVTAILLTAGSIFIMIRINLLSKIIVSLEKNELQQAEKVQDQNQAQTGEQRQQTHEKVAMQLKEITTKGKKTLRNICIAFIVSLVFLFLVPYISESSIILISLILVGITMLAFIDLAILLVSNIQDI